MKKFKFLLLLLIAVLTSGVSAADYSNNRLVPKDDLQIAKNFIEQIAERNFLGMKEYMVPQADKNFTKETFEKIMEHVPEKEVLSTILVGFHTEKNLAGEWKGNFILENEYADFWIVYEVLLIRKDDQKAKVAYFTFTKNAQSHGEMNKFVFGGKSLFHYLVLFSAILVFLLVVITAIVCIRTKMEKRKWLWMIFILSAIGVLNFDWNSGTYLIKLTHFQFLGAGYLHPPTVISVGFPLGAILFWFKKKKIDRDQLITEELNNQ